MYKNKCNFIIFVYYHGNTYLLFISQRINKEKERKERYYYINIKHGSVEKFCHH